jgi:hypothetical protein
LVRHFISTRVGIAYGRERGRPLRPELGFRRRRLRHRHLKAKPAAQVACRAAREALLADWPQEWELRCVDEATVRRHPTWTAQWGVVDEVPEVPTGDEHTQGQVDGAVAPLTGRTPYHLSPTLGKDALATFWPHRLADYPEKCLLVIPNPPDHLVDAMRSAAKPLGARSA